MNKTTKANGRPFWTGSPSSAFSRSVFFIFLAKIFGLTFIINLMESGETKAIEKYKAVSEQFPIVRKILENESRHETELAAMMKKRATSAISVP
ncbi:hypothetical protein [uncultured Desulfovibrio sp.]|uniref:hypothetical protein n=1 Tax=uncultured Desulfovibrio sp. TaxID=167968 RepID=UPI0003A6F59F|nr:hypothetical protein [uncultured Desulfovibrio sp.]